MNTLSRPRLVLAAVGYGCLLLPLAIYSAPYLTVVVPTLHHRARSGSFPES